MAERRQSLVRRATLKVLNVLPHRALEEPQQNPYYPLREEPQVPQVQRVERRFYEPEPETRSIGRRKRTLSLSCYDEDVVQLPLLSTDPQSTSWLFNLPKEIRLMIYNEVLGGMLLHIVRRKTRLGHRLCMGNGDPQECITLCCRGHKLGSGVHTDRGNGGLIQILLSCRKIYSEAIDVLYTNNVFDFDSLESFVSFSCEVLPQRLDSVRSIQLDLRFKLSILYTECTPRSNWPRWERTWRIIANMIALQEVRVRFAWPDMTKFAREELRILEPLELVTGLKLFEVTMHSLLNPTMKDRNDLPFRIIIEEPHGVLSGSTSWTGSCRTKSFAESLCLEPT